MNHPISLIGINYNDPKEKEKIERKVEVKVKEIIDKLKEKHSKFIDDDFGPTEKDEFGAISFYGNGKPDPAGSKYPSPDTLKWERPLYADDKFKDSSKKTDVPSSEKKSGGEDDDTAEEGSDFDEEDLEDEDDEYGFSCMNEENEIWCKKGKLFYDGTSSGDVIQVSS